MLPYQASGISGKSPEDGGGENESLAMKSDEIGGIEAGEKLRCIADFTHQKSFDFFFFRFTIYRGFSQERKFGDFRVCDFWSRSTEMMMKKKCDRGLESMSQILLLFISINNQVF